MLHWSQTLALTATINSHFRATCSSLINIFTLTQPGLTLPRRAQIVQCWGGRGEPQPQPGAAASRGKISILMEPPLQSHQTFLNLLPAPFRTGEISKNPEAASPQALWQWNCAPWCAQSGLFAVWNPTKTPQTSHPPHHTNTTTNFLTTASTSFFLSSMGGEKLAQFLKIFIFYLYY